MEKTLTYAIVGCGGFAGNHLVGMTTMPGVKVIALCDIHIDLCHEKKELYNLSDAQCYDDYNEMLKNHKPDIVIVATADFAHRDATIAALKAGCHVMCEKPMSLYVQDCKDMIKASKETGNLLMVGQICRFTPGFVKAKSIVDEGLIGDIFFIESEYAHDYTDVRGIDNWRMHPDREPIIGGACHAVDLMRWIAGDPTEVMAYSNHKMLPEWSTNDTTIAIMKFPNDVIGKVFTSNSCKRDYTMRTVIYGSKGTIIVDNTSTHLTLYLEKASTDANFADGFFFGDGSERGIKHMIKVAINNHNIPGEHKAMRDAVIDGKPLLMTAEEGAKTVMVCRAVVEAAKTGKAVTVDYSLD